MLLPRLPRAVLRSRTPPHNFPLPSSSNGASSLRHYRRDPFLFSNLGTVVPFQSHVHSVTGHSLHLQDLRNRPSCECHTTALLKQRPRASLRPMASVLPRRVHSPHLSFLPLHSPMSVPHLWDHIPLSPLQPTKGVLVPPLREPTLPPVPRPALVVDPSQSPCLLSHPWYVLDYPNHLGMATSTMQTVISCIINIVSRCFRETQAQHAGTPPRLLQRLVGGFMRSILQEASDHVPQVSDQFIAYTGDTDLAILLKRDTSPTLQSLLFTRLRQARTRGAWQFLWFEDCCEALPFLAPPTFTFCSVHIHSVVVKKTRCLH